MKKTHDVFGVSNQVLPDSYVDRGGLDELITTDLERPNHVAIRGESKCGKTWLRQQVIENPIVVQCRHGKSMFDLYKDALSQLDIRLQLEERSEHRFSGHVESSGEIGQSLIVKIKAKLGFSSSASSSETTSSIRQDINNLSFVAELIKESGRRLVIEDFHYLAIDQRRSFAFDLKTLWDYGLFVIIIGIWTESNMLMFLNPDLTGRVREQSIFWSDEDLKRVLDRGGNALNISFGDRFKSWLVSNSYGNVGILQRLTLDSLDEQGVRMAQPQPTVVDRTDILESAAMRYAEELNQVYQQFAKNVSSGIRKRSDSTGIYAHVMSILLEETSDEDLMHGVSVDYIFDIANRREPRIQKGNLKRVLEKFDRLQVDEEGRGLVLSYNQGTEEVTIVDRQLLLYRRFSTVKWPWEDMIHEALEMSDDFKVDPE